MISVVQRIILHFLHQMIGTLMTLDLPFFDIFTSTDPSSFFHVRTLHFECDFIGDLIQN